MTGSNGKTTTTELIGHIHREAGLPVAVAGNVGTALHARSPGTLGPATTVVCEASSFQLEDTVAFAPEAAVLLNLARTTSTATGRSRPTGRRSCEVFARQGNDGVAVAPLGLGIEDLGGCARRVCFGDGPGAELAERAGQLWWDEQPLIARRRDRPARRAQPQNAMAAAAVTLARGRRPPTPSPPACARSRGVAHRLEEVATVGRRPLRQRLQGHQRRVGAGRHRLVPRRRARDPRRARQGRRTSRARRRRPASARAPRT